MAPGIAVDARSQHRTQSGVPKRFGHSVHSRKKKGTAHKVAVAIIMLIIPLLLFLLLLLLILLLLLRAGVMQYDCGEHGNAS